MYRAYVGGLASLTASSLQSNAADACSACVEQARRVRNQLTRANEAAKHLACGACSAVVSRTVVAPLERVKMELILNSAHNNGVRSALTHIWDAGGAAHPVHTSLKWN